MKRKLAAEQKEEETKTGSTDGQEELRSAVRQALLDLAKDYTGAVERGRLLMLLDVDEYVGRKMEKIRTIVVRDVVIGFLNKMFLLAAVAAVTIPNPAVGQGVDSLPKLGADRLETEPYIPTSIEGLNSFMRMRDLSSTDEFLIRNGVQTASKQSWGRETADYMVFVWTEVYIFDSAKSAQSIMNW